ncbi:protoporphyrinogen oxidase [Aerosakkonema funiforme]|uniref:protoporphyrinogen oxidase n=1 Tax=Oscillatoriophycideae TaxID=1301283 RepID=UPI002AC8139F|nr:protoporphyrinogen oxidase [Aerosakkonema funiforme]
MEARTLVLTSPAYVTSEVWQNLAPSASQALKEIPYPPVACVVLAYPETALKHPLRGFGNLIPRGQGIRTLGTIWSSSLFPGRAPAGWQLLTNFIGGATDIEIGDLDDEQIVRAVHQDIRRILLKQDLQPKVIAVHLWKRAIPQYTLGHHQRLEQINRDLEQFPGLFLCSNYFDGVSLGDCVKRAVERSAEIRQYLQLTPVG